MEVFDHIIKNGSIIDGSGAPRYRADIAISAGIIVKIGDLSTAQAEKTIDARDLIVSPGFIDVHAHSDAWLLRYACFLPKVSQGYTTEFIMLDGISYAPVNQRTYPEWITYLRGLNGLDLRAYQGWQSIGDYMKLLDQRNCQNSATFIPYGNVRSMVCGFERQPVDDFQLQEIRSLVTQGMAEGALGISTGFDYLSQCFASSEEVIAVCQETAKQKGVYVSHVRYQSGTLEGLKEAVAIGKKAQVPVHISHLKGSTAAEAEAILAYLETTAVNEVDFSFDVYPYSASSTLLSTLLPHEVWVEGSLAALHRLRQPRLQGLFDRRLARLPLDRILIAWTANESNRDLEGKTLEAYINSTGRSPAQALTDLLIEDGLATLLVFLQGEDALVSPFLAHPHGMIGSDGIFQERGLIHPRLFGTVGRILGRCVRDLHLFTLEEAVKKLSGYPAARFGLPKRGTIQEGNWADLVCFDAKTVNDTATFSNPRQNPTGIAYVMVNGTPIWEHGEVIFNNRLPLPGRFLHKEKLTDKTERREKC